MGEKLRTKTCPKQHMMGRFPRRNATPLRWECGAKHDSIRFRIVIRDGWIIPGGFMQPTKKPRGVARDKFEIIIQIGSERVANCVTRIILSAAQNKSCLRLYSFRHRGRGLVRSLPTNPSPWIIRNELGRLPDSLHHSLRKWVILNKKNPYPDSVATNNAF